MASEQSKSAKILGLGLDNQDGQVRLTRVENFHLVGGSHDTHEQMQEKAIKFNEKLASRGKELDQLELNEFQDLAAQCQMNVVAARKSSK